MKTNNINCFIKNLKKNKMEYKIINNYDDYKNDNIYKLIIPGIGNYNSVINYLKLNNLDKVIIEHNYLGKKILAICIGMQILTEIGYEGGEINGLSILKNSKTVLLESNEILPNIGWNNLIFNNIDINNIILKDINTQADFYFVHSYTVKYEEEKNILAKSKFGNTEFIAMILTDNILATQFHPEKSGNNGLKLIKNFLLW